MFTSLLMLRVRLRIYWYLSQRGSTQNVTDTTCIAAMYFLTNYKNIHLLIITQRNTRLLTQLKETRWNQGTRSSEQAHRPPQNWFPAKCSSLTRELETRLVKVPRGTSSPLFLILLFALWRGHNRRGLRRLNMDNRPRIWFSFHFDEFASLKWT